MRQFMASVLAVLVVAQACDNQDEKTPTLGELQDQWYVIAGEYGLGIMLKKKGDPLGSFSYTCESGMQQSKRDPKQHCKRITPQKP